MKLVFSLGVLGVVLFWVVRGFFFNGVGKVLLFGFFQL